MISTKNWITTIFIFLIWILFLFFSKLINLISDYWWFDNLGFSGIFMIGLKAKLFVFIGASLIFFIFTLINLLISTKINKTGISFKFKALIVLFFSFVFGIVSYNSWFTILQYFWQVPFNMLDPIFMKDISFYIFSLPFFTTVWSFVIALIIFNIVLVVLDYLQSFLTSRLKHPQVSSPEKDVTPSINIKTIFSELKRYAVIHIAILGSFLFMLLAVKHYLTRFSIMYSKKGIVVGAGYTDVIAFLPIIKILMVLAIIISVLFYVWIIFQSKKQKPRKLHILSYGIIIYLVIFFIGLGIIPSLIQSFIVSPNEINLEKPYIENNIKFTKIAYGLDNIEEKDFDVQMNLNQEVLLDAKETMDNVRILDWRPLTQTYKQTQEIRLYYDLSGIDIDHYTIDNKYTSVMLAPREMNQRQITTNAKTWVNLHMVYTHGYGVVMSPVNSITKEGMPNYIIQDIPPINLVDEPSIQITKPQIYYGENDNTYVFANTKANEFDYPKGNTNEYINYDGKGGIVLDSFFKKLIMALKFGDIKILLSSDITPQSKILFSRNIQERITKLTPFIMLDNDPYIVISDGQLYWIQDAYTITNNFPYSDKFGSINYIRNSLKIVVDAYNGDVTYYVIGKTDPIIRTYARIFSKQFKSIESMPSNLREHIRYPVDLFKIQSNMLNTYHMNDAIVFYNKEDAWQTPSEIYGTGQKVEVEPYYMIIKLPNEQKEEFVLMSTFTPIKKDNMVAWMAARSDGDDYGKLLLYKFSKDKLVYGPLQIEAKFDQDSEISQQLTLWGQQGSRVTRGNLLIIPIKDSILYVEPLYIQAEQGQLPQLKRILVSDGERVVMEKTLGEGLSALFGKAKPTNVISDTNGNQAETVDELIIAANDYYSKILESMGKDWLQFGENFDKLGEVLNKLN
jgi:uncharacterized membrane protein (UPF0182 family)